MGEERQRLPSRRASFGFTVIHRDPAGPMLKYHITWSPFVDKGDVPIPGTVAEIFVVGGKVGNPMQALTRDMGLAVSIAMQHGVTIQELLDSLTRLDDGQPAGPLGSILEKLKVEVLAQVPPEVVSS